MVCKENMIVTQFKTGVCKCWGQRCVPTWANCYVKLLRWSIQVCTWRAHGGGGCCSCNVDVVGEDQDLGSGYDSYELANLSRIQLSLILLCSTILLKNQILINRCVYIGLVVKYF